jgi:translation initiation factor 2B subunit (eIF-2B alpha/beta/delta family)
MARELEAATVGAAVRAAQGIEGRRRVLTHSASATCLQTLLRWGRNGRRVVVTESRPGREGIEMARKLATREVEVTLVSDAAIGLSVPECDAVLVGADAITADGQLINKAGTLLAALAAREAGVPAYAVAQTHKICPRGWPVALTPQPPRGLASVPGVRVANLVFDATPLDWFDVVFTEQGRLTERLLRATSNAVRTDWCRTAGPGG